jgi:uncharacterized protein YbjT (DUF2867 family)
MQNYLGLASRIREDGVIYRNGQEARGSVIDVSDVAAVSAAVLTADDPPRALDPTGREAHLSDDIARMLSDATGCEVRYVNTEDQAARTAMASNGMPKWLAEVMVKLHVRRQGPDFDDTTSDVVESLTGFPPPTFPAFLAGHPDAFRP